MSHRVLVQYITIWMFESLHKERATIVILGFRSKSNLLTTTWEFTLFVSLSRVMVMNIWNTHPSRMLRFNNITKGRKGWWFKTFFLLDHLFSQSPISTHPLSSYRRLCWMRRMFFTGPFICQWAWRRNNYLSLWSITWLLTGDTQDVWGTEPGPGLEGEQDPCTAWTWQTPKNEHEEGTLMYIKHANTICIASSLG